MYPRVYVQFNELVFQGLNNVENADLSGDFKIDTTEYPFRHGSYYSGAYKNGSLLMGEQDLQLDIEMPFMSLTRIQAMNYNDFIQYNFNHAGKLWAFDTGGKLIWAFAIPKHPAYTDYEIAGGHIVKYQMDFLLPDGVWHIANTNYVYLEPYDMCEFKDCLGTGKAHQCNEFGECSNAECDVCGMCAELDRYCNTCWNPYNDCDQPYRIVYNCGKAAMELGYKDWGEKYYTYCDVLGGKFISNGLIDSPVTITLMGWYVNPVIEFGCTHIKIKGTYEGRLVIYPHGNVEYFHYKIGDTEPERGVAVPYEKIEYTDNQLGLLANYDVNYFYVTSDEPWAQNFAFVKVDELVL